MIIDCISDCHGFFPKLEGGDLLIVAGDLTARDTPDEHLKFAEWFANQNYKYRVFIAGNHDNELQSWKSAKYFQCAYLFDSGTEFKGLKIWGSPWTRRFEGMNPNCMAFTCETEEELAEKWALIPHDTDILITHSPPHGILDTIGQEVMKYGIRDIHAGSKSLRDKVYGLRELKLHCFGHVHEAYNIMTSSIKTAPKEKIRHPTFVNASHVNEHYEPVNKPIRIEP